MICPNKTRRRRGQQIDKVTVKIEDLVGVSLRSHATSDSEEHFCYKRGSKDILGLMDPAELEGIII